jgi:hypothetical protein
VPAIGGPQAKFEHLPQKHKPIKKTDPKSRESAKHETHQRTRPKAEPAQEFILAHQKGETEIDRKKKYPNPPIIIILDRSFLNNLPQIPPSTQFHPNPNPNPHLPPQETQAAHPSPPIQDQDQDQRHPIHEIPIKDLNQKF